jgi:hypothetical protein
VHELARRPSKVVALLLVILTTAPSSGRATSQSDMPRDWIEVSVDKVLTLRAPPGTAFQPQSGIDSFTGTLRGPDFTLDLDYGPFAALSADQSGIADYAVQDTLLDGKQAKIVSGILDAGSPTQSYFIALYVTGLRTATASRPLGLVITGRLSRPDHQTLIRGIFATIRFAGRG